MKRKLDKTQQYRIVLEKYRYLEHAHKMSVTAETKLRRVLCNEYQISLLITH